MLKTVDARVLTITEHKTFMCFRCEFRIVMRISNPTFCTEDFEITRIGFLVDEEFIGCFLQKLVKIDTIDCMACRVNGFSPEFSWSLVFI